ncbi:MAG: hypothetical protein KDJ36_00470 [Hyphomicrobiaceae bacterium]|nr:hypothetical protein [Hyphomicrobiaceae bacterium]
MTRLSAIDLAAIPVLDVGPDYPFETLVAAEARAHALIDAATKGVPRAALRSLDAVSRRWLEKWEHRQLEEIDRIAARLGRPGAYFLAVNYEWGCTTGVCPAPDGGAPRLVRVLDWRTPGLGLHVVAARVKGAAGPFVALTWPGYIGVLQASAPGRFAAAINQAPMPMRGGGIYPFDWLANKIRLWRTPHDTPAHLLRTVFEHAADYAAARRALIETPIAAPAIYALAGCREGELAIIERTEDAAHVHDGASAAANAWAAPGWRGRERGSDSAGRAAEMRALDAGFGEPVEWLRPPILNARTRLAMIAEPATGRLVAQGFAGPLPVTATLTLETAAQ